MGLLALLVLVIIGYFLLARALAGRYLQPVALPLLLILLGIEAALIGLNLLTDGQLNFAAWFFLPSSELAVGAAFSAGQLLVIALAALLIGLLGEWAQWWQRPYWLILATLFGYLCVDEYWSLHETVAIWRYLFPLAGLSIVGLSGLAFAVTIRRDWAILGFIVLGLGTMGFAGVALDAFANEALLEFGPISFPWLICEDTIAGIPCQSLGAVEEFLEMAGASVILLALLSYAKARVPARRWRTVQMTLAGGAVAWGVWAVANLWLIPTLEVPLLAEPAQASYQDDALALVGYRTSAQVAVPGETLDVTLYFRAQAPLPHDYFLSVHVLAHPEVESVAQFDMELGAWTYPSSAWVPGFAVRNTATLTLPDDLPTPASYWIMARVWEPGADITTAAEGEGLPVGATDRALVTQDALILFSLPVLPSSIVRDIPPEVADFRFDGGFALTGYALPETAQPGGELPLTFWWQTGDDPAVDAPLVQFVHLYAEDDTPYSLYDGQPFGGRFPVPDWPGGIYVQDDGVRVALPEDLPPGVYRVFTGLYDPATVVRVPVHDADGRAIPNGLVPLGTVRVE